MQSVGVHFRFETLEPRVMMHGDPLLDDSQLQGMPLPDQGIEVHGGPEETFSGDLQHDLFEEPHLDFGELDNHLEVDDPGGQWTAPLTTTVGGELGTNFALNSIPKLHSNTDTPVKLFLDFDGHFDAQWGGFSNVSTPAYDIDGDATTFSQQELDNITDIWKRLAEDFAPFHIDVTTEDPGDFSDGVGMRVAIGGEGLWTGGRYGGVAYINTFTWSSIANTAYVFSDNLGGGYSKYVAEASAHEAGHSFGLYHQSTYDANGNKVQEYNTGDGYWAPNLGVGYSATVTTWHNGTSSQSSTTYQDDMAILAGSRNGFGYRPDDHGDTTSTATRFENSSSILSASGLIAENSDNDWFSFSTFAGDISLTLNVAEVGANLDSVLELRAADGSLIATADDSATLGASLSATVETGTYYLVVRSTGQYGHVGNYTLDGTISLLNNFSLENNTLIVTGSSSEDGFRYLGGTSDRLLLNDQVVDVGTLLVSEILFQGGNGRDNVRVSDGDTLVNVVNLWSEGGRFQTGKYLFEFYSVNTITLDGTGDNPANIIDSDISPVPPGVIQQMGSATNRGALRETQGGLLQRNDFHEETRHLKSNSSERAQDIYFHNAYHSEQVYDSTTSPLQASNFLREDDAYAVDLASNRISEHRFLDPQLLDRIYTQVAKETLS